MENFWWLNVWVERLRKRGRFSEFPQLGERCFYANPMRSLAQDEQSPPGRTDLCLDWPGLQVGDPSVWALLRKNHPENQEDARTLQRFHAFSEGHPYKWACFCEWLAQEALINPTEGGAHWAKWRFHFQMEQNDQAHFRRNLLLAYVEIFERVAKSLNLDDAEMRPFYPTTNHNGDYSQWQNAPPFASMLLIKFLHASRGEGVEQGRGNRNALQYRNALQTPGGRTTTPGGVKDFPKLKRIFGPPGAIQRFTYAMAVDNYLVEHPAVTKDLCKRDELAGAGMSTSQSSNPLPRAEIAAEAMGLPYLISAGGRGMNGGASRFVNTADWSATGAKRVAAKLVQEGGAPCFQVALDVPAEFPADIYDLKAVIFTEARIDGSDVSDAVFGFVDMADGLERGDKLMLNLMVRPIHAFYFLLYQMDRCRIKPAVRAVFMPVSWDVPGNHAFGFHVVLGELNPATDA